MPYNIHKSIVNEPYYAAHKGESDKACPRKIVKHRDNRTWKGINSSLLHPYIPLGNLDTLMELQLSRQRARKKKRSRRYGSSASQVKNGSDWTRRDESNEVAARESRKEQVGQESVDEDFVLFEGVKGSDLEDLSRDFVRARGGSKQTIKSKLGYSSLRQAILASEDRKVQTKLGRSLGFVPHPPIKRAIHGSSIAEREAQQQGLNRRGHKNADSGSGASAIDWAKRHLKSAKTKVPLPKVLNKVFVKAENKEIQRLEAIMEAEFEKLSALLGRDAKNSKINQNVLGMTLAGGANTNDNNKHYALQHFKEEVHNHKKELHSMLTLSSAFDLPKIPKPEKAFSEIDENEEVDIDKCIEQYADQDVELKNTTVAPQNETEKSVDGESSENVNFASNLFACDPQHPLHDKLMNALDASNWALETREKIIVRNNIKANRIGQAKKLKSNPNNFDLFPKGHVPTYVGYVSKGMPNTEQTLHAAVDACNGEDFWEQSALMGGRNSSGRSFDINKEIPDPKVLSDREILIEKLRTKDRQKRNGDTNNTSTDDEIIGVGTTKTEDPIFQGILRPGKTLNPAYNLLQTNRDTVRKQNEMFENLELTIKEMDYTRPDVSRRRFFAFKGDDSDTTRRRTFTNDMAMMRLGDEVIRLEQAAHNLENGKWFQKVTMKTKGMNGSHLTLQEKKLLFALHSIVEDGNDLTPDLFFSILEQLMTREDLAVFPLQNLIDYIREEVLDIELKTYWEWLQKQNIPIPKRIEEKLAEEGLI